MSDPQTRHSFTTLSDPRVGALVLQAYLEMVARKNHNGAFDLVPTKNVMLVEGSTDGGRDWEPAAIAMFMYSDRRVMWLDLLHVFEAWRGRGLARSIFEVLKKLAREANMLSLEYGTDVNNTSMRSVAKRLGHREMAVLVSVPIEE